MKKKLIFIIAIVSIVIGYFIEVLFNKVNIDNVVDCTVDINGNVYVLSYQRQSKIYNIIKSNSNGTIAFEKKIKEIQNGHYHQYGQIEVDSDENIYLLESEFSPIDQSEYSQLQLTNEKIIAFDEKGKYFRDIATVNYDDQEEIQRNPYIYKIQIVGKDLKIMCNRGEGYEILYSDLNAIDKPKVMSQFGITSDVDTSTDYGWVTDMAVLSNGKIVYATKRGELYIMDDQNIFKDISSTIGGEACVTDFSIDENDNLYFTDIMSGNFYKFNVSDLTIELLYSKSSIINNKRNINLEDVTYINAVQSSDYFAMIKGTNNQGYIRFGKNQNIFYKMNYNFFTDSSWKILIASVLVFGILVGSVFLYNKFKIGNIKLSLKIGILAFPMYILAMIVIAIVSITNSLSNYSKVISTTHNIGGNIILNSFKADDFIKLNHVYDYMSPEYIIVQDNIFNGFETAEDIVGGTLQTYITYTVDSEQIYIAFNNYYSERKYYQNKDFNFRIINTPKIPLTYLLDDNTVSEYYRIWNQMVNGEFDTYNYKSNIKDPYGDWISSFLPIKNSSGSIVGMLEVRSDKKEYQTKIYTNILNKLLIAIGVSTIILFVYVFFILKKAFKPLKELKDSVNSIGEGNWNIKVQIESRDELFEIGKAFNLMTERMNKYVSDLVDLNKEYIRFLPVELLHLLGKDKIKEVRLYDQKVSNVNILYVSFNIKNNPSYSNIEDTQYFNILNKIFDKLFLIVENNNGVVHWFNASEMTILFPYGAQDAVTSSLQFKEAFEDSILSNTAKMILNTGETLIGVLGTKSRMSISLLSSSIYQINYIEKQISNLGLSHFAIEPIIHALGYSKNCNYRLVGQVEDLFSGAPLKIYEFINETNVYEKDLYSVTKGLFESGVQAYIEGKFMIARKAFANVLRVNGEDRVSKYYLMLCDRNEGKTFEDWKGYIF